MNQGVCAWTSFHGYCESVGLWEPTRTPGGFIAYCFCCNYNRKKDVSARRSSCCGGLRTGGWRGFGEGAPWPVGGLRGMEGVSLLSSVGPLLLGGKVPTLSSLAIRWRVASHSRGPGRPGKVEAPWRPSRRGGRAACLRPAPGGEACPRSHCLTGEQPLVGFVS